EALHRAVLAVDLELAGLLERGRVEIPEHVRAVAHYEAPPVVREPPALAGVGEGFEELERVLVVDEALLRAPGELDYLVARHGRAFAEVNAREVTYSEDFAGFEVYLSQRRLPAPARAFVEDAVFEKEALCEGRRVVGIGGYDLVAVGG